MAPSDVCQSWLDAYCMNVCPHASSHELVARFDAAKGHPESAWRCYALETLSADRERYVTGTTYCTRHDLLRAELALCESKTRDTSDDDATLSVAVDAAGGATTSPPHLAATPCVFAGAEHGCVERADPLDEAAAASGPSIELVMAHCKESSHWLGDVQLGLRTAVPDAWLALHVYEKCGSKLETHWPRGGWARERRSWIQNKGEECYAYLTYITTWWKHLPEYVVFFQGDGVLNGERFRSKLQMWGAEVVATGMVDAWRSVNDHQYISVAPTQAACDAAALSNCFVHPEQHACMTALHRRHHPDDDAPDEALVWAMYTNAQFGVFRRPAAAEIPRRVECTAQRIRRRGARAMLPRLRQEGATLARHLRALRVHVAVAPRRATRAADGGHHDDGQLSAAPLAAEARRRGAEAAVSAGLVAQNFTYV